MIIRRRCHCRIRLPFMCRSSYPLWFLRMPIRMHNLINQITQSGMKPTDGVSGMHAINSRTLLFIFLWKISVPTVDNSWYSRHVWHILDSPRTTSNYRFTKQNQNKTKYQHSLAITPSSSVVWTVFLDTFDHLVFDHSFSHLFDNYFELRRELVFALLFSFTANAQHTNLVRFLFVAFYIIAFDAFLAK